MCSSTPSNTGFESTIVSVRWASFIVAPGPLIAASANGIGMRRPSQPALRARSSPILRDEKFGIKLRFRRSGRGAPVITPLNNRRQRHQDRFGTAVRLQAEQRSAIPDEVEF